MWNQITDKVGIQKRDAIWSHPDLLPSDSDIQDPTALIAKLSNNQPEDDMDQALRDLLS
jgi:uncharacterized protein (DUF2342 family)